MVAIEVCQDSTLHINRYYLKDGLRMAGHSTDTWKEIAQTLLRASGIQSSLSQ